MKKRNKVLIHINQITLKEMIDFFNQFGKDLEIAKKEIDILTDNIEKEMSLLELQIKEAYSFISFFSHRGIDELMQEVCVGAAMQMMDEKIRPHITKEFEIQKEITWGGKVWQLPDTELTGESKMTFGEFIDSKNTLQGIASDDGNAWEMLLSLACIFLKSEHESYSEEWLFENGERMNLMRTLPIEIAGIIGKWYDEFNNYLNDYFPLFSESAIKGGAHATKHMEQWGWINFLKEVAKAKIYDIPSSGMNSIMCARKAKAFDVLVDASEEKLFNEAKSLDMEAAYKKH